MCRSFNLCTDTGSLCCYSTHDVTLKPVACRQGHILHHETLIPTLQVRAEDVRLPEGAMFVIANSLTVNKKAVSADWQYNMRVTECRLATVALALACGIPPARTLLHNCFII